MIELNDETLEKYLKLQAEVKKHLEFIEETKKACKERGSFCTDNYACTVYSQIAKRLATREEMEEALTKELLEQLNLIRLHEFLIVKVSPKRYK